MSDDPLVWIEQTARKHRVTDDDMRHAITHRLHVSELLPMTTANESSSSARTGPGTRSSWTPCSSTTAPW